MFDGFGKSDPRKMPRHLFSGALHIDYSTALKANIAVQDFSICPRHWYVDVAFCCARCAELFKFTAKEQSFWYEEMRFYIESLPQECSTCRKALRHLKTLRQEYDRDVSACLGRDVELLRKQRMITVIQELDAAGIHLETKVQGVRQTLIQQVERLLRSINEPRNRSQ